MKNIGIKNPCSENWNEMTANEKGAFCQKCASQVHDFTKKSKEEIKQTLHSLIGQQVCGRITVSQEEQLNREFERWANNQTKRSFQQVMLFSLLVVFGLSLFSCETEQDKKKIVGLQTAVMRTIEEPEIIPQLSIDATVAQAEEVQFSTHYEVMGLMVDEVPQFVEPPVIKEDIEVVEYDRTMVGEMYFTKTYDHFLTQDTSTEEKIDLDENGNVLPNHFKAIVFPNPAAEQTTIELMIPSKNRFEINLFDMSGKLIQAVYSGELERGRFRQELNLIDLNPGMYLVTIHSSDFNETVQFVKN